MASPGFQHSSLDRRLLTRVFLFQSEEKEMKIEDVIMKHVLRFVPAKSLYRFKSVCKSWNQWISSPFFAHEQATHFTKTSCFFSQTDPSFTIPLDHAAQGVPFPSLSFIPEQLIPPKLRATSNGLLCCQSHDGTYFIANPTTAEWIQLPEPTLFHSSASAIALSFTPSTYNFQSHFQLVCAVMPHPSHPCHPLYFEIYSSRTNSWRVADSFYVYDPDFVFRGDGFCINGSSVCWEVSNAIALIFDLNREEYGTIELPHRAEGALTEICGELCYVLPTSARNYIQCGEVGAEGYSLCVFGGYDMRLRFRVALEIGNCLGEDFDGEVRVLSCVSDGFVMILVGSNVVLYDMKKRRGKVVRRLVDMEECLGDHVERFLPYVNSLVRVCPVEKMPPGDSDYEEVLRNMSIG